MVNHTYCGDDTLDDVAYEAFHTELKECNKRVGFSKITTMDIKKSLTASIKYRSCAVAEDTASALADCEVFRSRLARYSLTRVVSDYTRADLSPNLILVTELSTIMTEECTTELTKLYARRERKRLAEINFIRDLGESLAVTSNVLYARIAFFLRPYARALMLHRDCTFVRDDIVSSVFKYVVNVSCIGKNIESMDAFTHTIGYYFRLWDDYERT